MDLTEVETSLQELLASTPDGVAIAANQGGLDHRLFVLSRRYLDASEDPLVNRLPTTVVNPVIISRGEQKVSENEGCLSFPGLVRKVSRDLKIEVKFLDGKWQPWSVHLSGFWARVFQHEIDHLDGKTFVDDLPEKRRMKIAATMFQRKKGVI